MLVNWLQQHFSQNANIEDEKLKKTMWAADISKSGILIESVFRWRPDLTAQRPAILIKRGGWKVLRLGIDDRKMGGMTESGNREYLVAFQGAHYLYCMGTSPAEAEAVATEVLRELVQFGPLFRKTFRFLKFQVVEVGEISLVEEAKQNFVVPITIAYVADDAWEIAPRVPVLKHIRLSWFLS